VILTDGMPQAPSTSAAWVEYVLVALFFAIVLTALFEIV